MKRLSSPLLLAILMCLLPAFCWSEDATTDATKPHKVLVLAERGGLHEGFTAAGLQWLERQKERFGMELTVLSSAKDIKKGLGL